VEHSVVKLLPNSTVKTLLQKAKSSNLIIDVQESYFIVRNEKGIGVKFKGIKIREDLWGVTITL